MKPINKDEVFLIQERLEAYLDARLQKCHYTSKGFVLELFKNKLTSYLVISMDAQNPFVLDFGKIPFSMDKKTHPVLLFMKTHFEGKRLSAVDSHKDEKNEKLERILFFKFGYDNPAILEVRLFPHGQNIIAQSDSKKISFLPVKELKESHASLKFITRTLEELRDEAFAKNVKKITPVEDLEAKRDKLKEKKLKSLLISKQQVEEMRTQSWQQLGDFLVAEQSLEVPPQWQTMVDKKKSLSANIQNAFEKSKTLKVKIKGLQERIQILELELTELDTLPLESFGPNGLKNKFSKLGSGESGDKDQRKNKSGVKVKWKGYRYPLSGGLELFVGKNATENLSILRHAQSWDLWLHLKDYPGAHGIIRRPRGAEVVDSDIQKAARFVATHSKKSAHFLTAGDSFDVLIAECRFVRPIKGDKLGRVQYSDERVIAVRL